MQEGTTSRTDFFPPRGREKPRRASPAVLRMPRSLAVISRSQGSHLALSLFAHAFIFAGQLPRFRIPNSTHLVFVNSPAFCVLSPSTTSRPPSSCTNSCKLLALVRKALPSLFLRTSLLGGNTIRLVSWNYATRDAGRTIADFRFTAQP